MNIEANKIVISSAATFGILWIICITAVHFAHASHDDDYRAHDTFRSKHA